MKMRINDKISEIEKYLSELQEFIPSNFKRYLRDIKTKAACERYFEMIVEAAVDLAFLIIKDKNLKTPEEDKESFDILAKEKLITEELAAKLKDAKGMRNILAHQYGNVDDKVVFYSITEEIVEDVNKFIDTVKKAR